MTDRVLQVEVQGRQGSERRDPPSSGRCGFPVWAAIDRGRHIRICERPVEASMAAGESR